MTRTPQQQQRLEWALIATIAVVVFLLVVSIGYALIS
jgi:hypothetical protein